MVHNRGLAFGNLQTLYKALPSVMMVCEKECMSVIFSVLLYVRNDIYILIMPHLQQERARMPPSGCLFKIT